MQSSRLLRPAARLLSSRPGVGHSGHLSAELRNQHDGPAASGQGLTHAQKYLFDLNGFIVLRNMFDADIVERANDAVDAHLDRLHERKGQLRTSGLYGRESKALAGDGQTGRMDLGGMLGWEAPHREPFREVLSHPSVAKVLNELVGVGYRLDHSPLLIAQEKGAEGHTLHGGAVTESGEPAWPLAYSFRHGHMRNQLLTVCMQLSEAGQGDGGFCAVPGSHKANFPVPPALADLDDPEVCARLCTLYPRTTLPSSWDPSHTTQPFADFHSTPLLRSFRRSQLAACVVQPTLAPGDCLIFSEATLHGTLPWAADHQRRTVIYRFAPAGSAYGRGYHPSWPEATLDGMTACLLYTSPSPRDRQKSRMPSSA